MSSIFKITTGVDYVRGWTGSLTGGTSLFEDGAVSSPSVAFNNSTNSGIYLRQANFVDAVANGTPIFEWNSSNEGLKIAATQPLSWSSSGVTGGSDVFLFRDAANILALRNGTTAQTLRSYNTFTDASNYERGTLLWTGNKFSIRVENAGTGTARNMELFVSSGASLFFGTGGTNRWTMNSSGHITADADNSYDIGASAATRPRNVYIAGLLTLSGGTLLATSAALTNGAAAQTATITNGPTAGNPTKWIPITDNGTTRYIPAW